MIQPDIPYKIQIEEEGIDIKKIIFLVLRQWYWLALFGSIGLIAALGFNKSTMAKYSVSTSILIPEKSNSMDMQSMFKGSFEKPQNNIYNQIDIITSYNNVNQTLINLNWRISWYKKGLLTWSGMYKQEPFDVQETPNFVNPKGIAVYIKPASGNTYKISVDGNIWYNNSVTKVKFEEIGTFDRPFVNKYFNFTLLQKINNISTSNKQYYFVFNDLNDATQNYQNRINASLKDKKSDIILCSLVGNEPSRECDFLNELIKVYIDGKMNLQSESQRRSLDFKIGRAHV